MIPSATLDDWRQSLQELGCGDELTAQVMQMVQSRDAACATALLRRHKGVLLEELHHAQAKVDLLDFLLYTLKQERWIANVSGKITADK